MSGKVCALGVKLLGVGLVAMSMCLPAKAEKTFVVLGKALLCDDRDKLEVQIDIFFSADVNGISSAAVEGCWWLWWPAPAFVTDIGEYENKYVIITVAEIRIPGMVVQYGYSSFRGKVADSGI